MSRRPSPPSISQRKSDHIEIAAQGHGDFDRKTTLLEEVHLVHQSVPELAVNEIDLEATIAGRTLALPFLITGMTGGTEEAGAINRDLATAAEAVGCAFGVGSQRAMAEHAELGDTYRIRDVAPNVFLIGNIGGVQALALGVDGVAKLAESIDANAMAVHLNPGQELIQSGGDRDFRGQVEVIGALTRELGLPVVVKETGCGLSLQACETLAEAGVTTVDVSGAGGTSWVAVETRRADPESEARKLGELLWDWGLPTAVSVVAGRRAGLEVIASGGLRSGYDAARALALGARAVGFAAPALRAQRAGGSQAVVEFLERTANALRAVMLLSGAQSIAALSSAPRHLGAELTAWLDDLGLR